MNELAVTLFILIVPGILCLIIVLNFITHRKIDSFYFVLYSILLGLISFSFLQITAWIIEFISGVLHKFAFSFTYLSAWKVISQKTSSCLSAKEVVFSTLLAIPTAFVISWIINHKILSRLARAIGVTQKYGDENLFYYYLNSMEVYWVYIRDVERNLIYQGRIKSYSESSLSQEIVLEEVSVFSYIKPELIYSAPSLYLSREYGKLQIEQIPPEKFTENQKGGMDGKGNAA